MGVECNVHAYDHQGRGRVGVMVVRGGLHGRIMRKGEAMEVDPGLPASGLRLYNTRIRRSSTRWKDAVSGGFRERADEATSDFPPFHRAIGGTARSVQGV